VNGGAGDNWLNVYATNYVAPGSQMTFSLQGGPGNDSLTTYYSGLMDGFLLQEILPDYNKSWFVWTVAYCDPGSTGYVKWDWT
jgi:hypothetical protein